MAGATLVHIAERVLNRPLLIHPEKISVLQSVLGGRIGLQSIDLIPEASQFVGDTIDTDSAGKRTGRPMFRRTEAGVAIIDVLGTLVNRGAWIGASSGLTSYEGLQAQIAAVKTDPKTHAVILDLSSPGGEAVGAFETAAAVRDLAKVKRTVAVVNGMAASAAYAIASGATEIVTTETGVVGSIGVVLLHADYSAQLAEDGVKPTLIFAGAHKVDGNPFEPLSDAVKTDLQAEVNAFYEKFLATVETGRGSRTTRARAKATEARTFIGGAAITAGLADRLGTFESVLSELSRKGSSSPTQQHQGKTAMADSHQTARPAAYYNMSSAQQAEYDAAFAEGVATGSERALSRTSELMRHPQIKGNSARMSAAFDLASKALDMSTEDIVAFVVGNIGRSSIAASSEAGTVFGNDRTPGANDSGGNLDVSAIYGGRRSGVSGRGADHAWRFAVDRLNNRKADPEERP